MIGRWQILQNRILVDALLVELSKAKPISAKPAPIVQGIPAIRKGCPANSQVLFSTWFLNEILRHGEEEKPILRCSSDWGRLIRIIASIVSHNGR